MCSWFIVWESFTHATLFKSCPKVQSNEKKKDLMRRQSLDVLALHYFLAEKTVCKRCTQERGLVRVPSAFYSCGTRLLLRPSILLRLRFRSRQKLRFRNRSHSGSSCATYTKKRCIVAHCTLHSVFSTRVHIQVPVFLKYFAPP